MSHGPDIVVTSGGERLLAVEVKVSGDLRGAVRAMAEYMSRLLYPIGVVVVGTDLAILRRDFGAGTVEEVGRFPLAGIEGLEPPLPGPAAGEAFAARVQRWLVSLRDPVVTSRLPETLRGAVVEWILPELQSGEIRATGPRPLAHAS